MEINHDTIRDVLEINLNSAFMSILTIFESPESKQYFVDDVGIVWLHGTLLCKRLGFSNTNQAIVMHTEEDERQKVDTGKLGKKPWFVNEYGVWGMILAAKTPEAIDFKQKLKTKILPEIRKHGAYISETITPPQAIALSEKLAKIITPEKRPWTIHFGGGWQKEACRLCKVSWKHPRMAQFINQVVYDFFPKEAIAKLKQLNANGQEDHVAHHQFLQKEFDEIAYKQHLRDVESYMMASPDLATFWRLMSFRFKRNFQLDLFDNFLPGQDD